MKKTTQALAWIKDILEKENIPYCLTGGIAANFYGSKRPLADIDLEIDKKYLNKIAKLVKPYIIFGPKHYQDKNWDLELLTLLYKEQEIDLAESSAKIFNKIDKRWEKLPNHTKRATLATFHRQSIFIISKIDLINYKSKLRRRVDLEDLRQMKKTI